MGLVPCLGRRGPSLLCPGSQQGAWASWGGQRGGGCRGIHPSLLTAAVFSGTTLSFGVSACGTLSAGPVWCPHPTGS